MEYEIPLPLRNMMTERDSIKLQYDQLQNDLERLEDEKAKMLEDYEKEIDKVLRARSEAQREYEQYEKVIETMRHAFKLEPREVPPPESNAPKNN